MKRTMMAACILSLVACGGSKDDVATDQRQDWESQRQSLVYSFPDQGQLEVPVPSPVVLRFSSPVAETAPAIELREVGGAAVAGVELEWVDGRRGLIITPENKLKPLTEYVVQVPAIELEKGQAAARTIRFTTRGLHEGPRSLVARDTFEVVRTIPDGVNFAVTDFSSFRLQFSQPLDPSTVKYGDAGDSTVQLMGPEGLVDAHLLVSGPYITIDPKEDLTPGGDYRLNITGGLTSVYGDNLTGGSLSNPMPYTLTATPVDTTSPTTGERVSMVQDIADTGEISPLTGKPINLVPMASVLLGEETATQASGTLAAELAFVPNFPDQTPLRIKRGSLIEGASIDVLIGGEVPAGFESGKVRMDFLSDATGYLLPNEYSNSDDAPRQVRLWMDVAVSTETPAANGAITQDLLHIELVGTSIVEDGQMVINAVGVVEPNVLGSERATGVLSFYMKAYENQDNPPLVAKDTTSPVLQSWVPARNAETFQITDPLVLTFSEPLLRESLNDSNIVLTRDGIPVEKTIKLDGSSVIVYPEDGFVRSEQGEISEYRITVSEDVTDLAGNPFVGGFSDSFRLPSLVSDAEKEERWGLDGQNTAFTQIDVRRSGIVLSTYPGFPCALDTATTDLRNNIAGRCIGTFYGIYDGTELDNRSADDFIPVQPLAANKPIIVQFSKAMDEGSIELGKSFVVSKIDEDGNLIEEVDGELYKSSNRIVFWPKSEWQQGALYSYKLKSNGDSNSSAVDCVNQDAICDVDGLPLMTSLWHTTVQPPMMAFFGHRENIVSTHANPAQAGGPDMVQYFKGETASTTVLQSLTSPTRDRNANFYLDKTDVYFDEDIQQQGLYEYRNYDASFEQEIAAEGQPRIQDDPTYPGSEHALDPNGLVPPINSAKLLSRERYKPVYSESDLWGMVSGVNVGCGYSGFEPDNNESLFGQAIHKECPEEKFTYLTSSLNAEITGEFVEGKGVRVNIWPAQIMSTSVGMRIPSMFFMALTRTGPQIMRMRYQKDDENCIDELENPCPRSQPITGWIGQGENGLPVLNATVDLYIDAFSLQESLLASVGVPFISHDFFSYPITMKLTGAVEFNEDGTMVIEQYNSEAVSLDVGINLYDTQATTMKLLIPEYGSRLVFHSEIIK